MKILISPHNDDAALFASYIIQREKPLVISVTHATSQDDNGYERMVEDYKAMQILGVPICFLGINEKNLNEKTLSEKLIPFYTINEVYVPEYEENGNPHHNLVSLVADKLFPHVEYYKTYTGLEDRTIGREVMPKVEELKKKKQAMECYQTQIKNPLTAHYFKRYDEYR